VKRALGRNQHQRRSIRLAEYDYRRSGVYYVTVCTQDRACLFGQIVDGRMEVNDAGRMVLATWHSLCNRFPIIDLDAFIVMPNHVHGIIVITTNDSNMTHRRGAVGATLVVAHDDVPAHDDDMPMDDSAVVGVGNVPVNNHVPADDGVVVGAGLVPAHGRMPAHDRATTRVAPTLGDVIGAYKSVVTVQYARGVKTHGWTPFRNRLWQRNYYEHVIRDEDSLDLIRQYILDNPRRWDEDRYDPNTKKG